MGQECDQLADYSVFDANFPLDVNNEYHVTSNTTWGYNNMNVHGSVVIEPNKVLTIDGVTIHFGDSRKLGFTTNIVVKPGGDLVIKNGAVLTSLANCPTSMWDGIKALGNPLVAESSSLQSVVTISAFSIIENAYVGILCAEASPEQGAYGAPPPGTSGIVHAQNGVFRNNKFGVVMRPRHTTSTSTSNSYFFGCQFNTNSALNYVDEPPVAHLWFDQVTRMRIGGCYFGNSFDVGQGQSSEQLGVGIHAFNTAIKVLPMCAPGVWNEACSDATSPTYITNAFLVFRTGSVSARWGWIKRVGCAMRSSLNALEASV